MPNLNALSLSHVFIAVYTNGSMLTCWVFGGKAAKARGFDCVEYGA